MHLLLLGSALAFFKIGHRVALLYLFRDHLITGSMILIKVCVWHPFFLRGTPSPVSPRVCYDTDDVT